MLESKIEGRKVCKERRKEVEKRVHPAILLNGWCRVQGTKFSNRFCLDSVFQRERSEERNLYERLTQGDARNIPRLIKVGKELFGVVRYDSRDSSRPIESKSVRIQGTISRPFRECISVGESFGRRV